MQIRLDQNGIPTIQSENFNDVVYGMGYLHAQDRLWSMHFKRKVFEGKLSELAGSKTLDMDILLRSLKLEKNAQKKFENSSQKIKDILQCYSNGINDYVDSLSILPIEFLLTDEKFHKWEPHHSYALAFII
ncbi:penicillin amidase family protein, putative [Ichthyophthirius multifiliis]|uniref:Penicillin amidase family protein, putative n=1 Tax=Ichthyophthirius multifiliis TaxID=5932 RepID=G0QS39_ICHMU|nr:penicillin amidase family protein, putative [Ichthyophthirius multifiliis]EGR31981.1 penicillin amidase family protein, putative [Ichthyophthirius multifiliis]|eukprot:XP_004035467.1 penicillin amidase family protein, putative [Ichthyophthirius multifiliis]